MAEAVYWPNWDFNDVRSYIARPDPSKVDEFTRLVKQVIEPNYLPDKLPEKIHFLKGWRGEARESFVMQYKKSPYLIRVKNQVMKKAVADRLWTSHWVVMAIQSENKSVCVNKADLTAIFNFTDQFLPKKLSSSAQNYAGITNMDKPAFIQMDTGYFLAYPVGASRPDIDGVCIWTDGRTVLINLQERRKILIPPGKQG